MTFLFSTRTVNLLSLCLFCLALTLLSGCGGVSKLTPAEQAEVDKYVKDHGRNSLVSYLSNCQNEDEKLVLKYVKYFVSQGADVNAKDWRRNSTPLHHAVMYDGDGIEVVKFLVSKGADVNAKAQFEGYHFGRNEPFYGFPLDFAKELGREEIAKYLSGLK